MGRGERSRLAVAAGLVARPAPGRPRRRVWRWDGFTALHPAPTARPSSLRQRNRLAMLDGRDRRRRGGRPRPLKRLRRDGSRPNASRRAKPIGSPPGTARGRGGPGARAAPPKPSLPDARSTAETRLAALGRAAREARQPSLRETSAQAAETERELAPLPDPALARAALDAGARRGRRRLAGTKAKRGPRSTGWQRGARSRRSAWPRSLEETSPGSKRSRRRRGAARGADRTAEAHEAEIAALGGATGGDRRRKRGARDSDGGRGGNLPRRRGCARRSPRHGLREAAEAARAAPSSCWPRRANGAPGRGVARQARLRR